jgi:hypothetical protein
MAVFPILGKGQGLREGFGFCSYGAEAEER